MQGTRPQEIVAFCVTLAIVHTRQLFVRPQRTGEKQHSSTGGFMRRFPSIKKNSDFQIVYKKGKSYANRLLVMYVYRTESEGTRIGISVSKKVGNSVVRHRVTRLIRESFRLNREQTDSGLDIIVVARAAASDSDYKKIESAYRHLCGLHNIMKESK